MAFPIKLERDTSIYQRLAIYEPWATTESDPSFSVASIKSDGLLKTNYATVCARNDTGAITARMARFIGVHINPPFKGEEYTPYQISASVICQDENVTPYLIVGESPSTITSGAGGDTVTQVQLIATGRTNTIQIEKTVLLRQFTPDRPLCFAIGVLSNGTGGVSLPVLAHMSVRRLFGAVSPLVMDTRKI